MANKQHIEVLKQGVDAWNNWRESEHAKPDLSGLVVVGSHFCEIDPAQVIFPIADINFADLSYVNFSRADLSNTKFLGVFLGNANLSRANLTSAKFLETVLSSANLYRANLQDADLTCSNLTNVNLKGVNLSGADFTEVTMGDTIFADNDLREVRMLHSVRHMTPSVLGIDTIYRSKGNIPETFLRGVGIPEHFLEYMSSLTNKAFEFYSCFISYSTKDQEFADRLYADLQSKGVRCWFASKDLKIGDKFRQQIDESIRLHDKLLLILSEKAITSPWVEDEVEAALERERIEDRLVLLPISIDNTVWNSDRAWAASLRRMRHIGDFKDWKSHNAYKTSYERLLRDLKAESS